MTTHMPECEFARDRDGGPGNEDEVNLREDAFARLVAQVLR